MTPTTIVSTAIATRDWQDVHHDRDVAQARRLQGHLHEHPDHQRAGRDVRHRLGGPGPALTGVAIRLGAPEHPDDTMIFSGTVSSVADGIATIDVVGRVPLGDHVTGDAWQDGGPVTLSRQRPRSSASAPPSSRRTRAHRAAARRARRSARRSPTRARRRRDVDGMSTFTMDTNAEIEVARELGMRRAALLLPDRTTAAAPPARRVLQAAMAVATGVADVVVCYRALNERSGSRFGIGAGSADAGHDRTASTSAGTYAVRAARRRPSWVAMHAQRYMHEYGATTEDFGARRGRRPPARRDQPRGVVLRAADHARGPPGVALDRRAAAPARLLPGERRRGRAAS